MTPVDFRLEVVVVPVADVDRAKAFYTDQAGFRFVYFNDPDGNGWAVQEIKAPQTKESHS